MDDEIAAHFRRYAAMVYRRAFVLLGDTDDAEDAAQEVFIRFMSSRERFDGRHLPAWLYRITTNYCLTTLRARRVQTRLLDQHAEPLRLQVPGAPPLADMVLLRRLLAAADEREAQAAIYIYVDGMSHDEVALVLGVSRRTVGNLVNRFGRWARRQLEENIDAARD